MQADMQRHKKIIPVICKKMCDSGKTKTTLDVQMQLLWLYRFLLRCHPRCKQDEGPHCKRSCFETLQHGRRSGDFSQSRSSHRHNKLCGFPGWHLSGLSPFTRNYFIIPGSNISLLRNTPRLSFQSGSFIPRAFWILSFDSTEYAGRFAGVGYSSVVHGFTVQPLFVIHPHSIPCFLISFVKSHQLVSPRSVQW